MKRLLRPAIRVLLLFRRAPRPTATGVVVLVLAILLGTAALTLREPAVLVTFGLVAAAVLVSFALPVLNLRGIEVERLPIENPHAGETFPVTLTISRPPRSRDRFAVLVADGVDGPYRRPGHVLVLRLPEEPVTVRYRAAIRDRGRHEVRTLELSTRAPFGLFEHRRRRKVVTEVLVYPRIGTFRHDPLPFTRFSRLMTSTETVHERGEEEFRNLREYRPGDSPRHIAWRATARHGDLMVKEMEDDLTKKVSIFLESRLPPKSGTRGRVRLERAISFTATLVRELSRRRYQVSLHLLSPGPMTVSAGRGGRRLNRVMEALAVLAPSPSGELADLIRVAPPEAFMAALPVLILPAHDPERVARAVAPIPRRCRPVVFRADGAWEKSLFGAHENSFPDIHVRR